METLFVFYTFKPDYAKIWKYRLPKGWQFIGSGMTSAINGRKLRYEREEQFQGPASGKKQMELYLKDFFEDLKKEGIIKVFKVSHTYSP